MKVEKRAVHRFAKGDWVVSRYKAPWKGIVLSVEKRTKHQTTKSDLLTVRIIVDKHGKVLKRRMITTLDESWLDPYTPSEGLVRSQQRPVNYDRLSPEEQWKIDSELGILDWDGK